MSKFKVGDKVVCIAEERPDYFIDNGEMDYLLNEGAVLEVVGSWVVYKGNSYVVVDPELGKWHIREEHLKLHGEAEMKELIAKVQEWSTKRNIDKASPKEQSLKLIEEVGELASGLLKSNDDLVIDSLGDILVVLIILHQQLGLTLEQTLNVAYNEIKDRKGKTVDGVFIKENDL